MSKNKKNKNKIDMNKGYNQNQQASYEDDSPFSEKYKENSNAQE